MENLKHPDREIYHRVSDDSVHHRCKKCYKVIFADKDGIVMGGGYVRADRHFPHATWCPNIDSF
jgi:hypothetical protein